MAASNIILKKIDVGDAALLSKVAAKAYADHYLHFWYDNGAWYIESNFAVHNLKKELADANAVFFIVYEAGIAAGFLKINIDAATDDYTKDDALELERIYLTKAAAGKGIGAYLLNFTFDFAKSKNKKLVWLKVMDSSKSAINFYQKNGFEIFGTYHLYFTQMKPELRGMFFMKRHL